MRVGIDLDNTLICYDQAFARVGKEEGLLSASFQGNKSAVKRTLLAERPDGFLWERLQGLVYGQRIDAAELFEGVAGFLEACRQRGDMVTIVSHKTERAHHDPLLTDLRAAALQWMERNRFFEGGLGIDRRNIFFEGTRDEKVRRIRSLACDVFVDDLVEVLEHADMPPACRRILFGSDPQGAFEQYSSWHEVRGALFPTG